MEKTASQPRLPESYFEELVGQLVVAIGSLREQCEQLKFEVEEQRDFIRSMKEDVRDRDRMLTLREAAKIAGVGYETMIAWVNWKDIEAVNVAKKQGRRPRWRIAPDELKRFLRSRARFRYEPPPRRRRRPPSDGTIHFYV